MMDRSAFILKTTLLQLMMVMMMMMMYGTDAKMEIIISKQDVEVGEESFLLCKAGGEGEITWQKDGEDITDEDKVSTVDETSSKFLIKKVTMEDMGRYTCQCEFDNGHSDSVHYQLYVYEGPSFGSTPIYHEFLEGTNGLVPCVVAGQPAVDVHWLRDREQISSNERLRVHQTSDNTLLIEKVRREDAGTYVCEAKIRGRPINKRLSISVVVNALPTVHLKEREKKVLAGQETNVSLICLVDGHPKPNITWTLPTMFNPSQHHFNSDRSQLTIRSVARADYGEYVCTATNKLAESSETLTLHVYEAPEVFVSAEQQSVAVGKRVSVSCNVTGHPDPTLHWINKYNGQELSSTGHVHVVDGVLIIDEVMPSDGGLYSCMAVSTIRNASRDVAIYTTPDIPHYLIVSPGPTSVFFSLKTLPINGGTPITSFSLQWRQSEAEEWKEHMVSVSDPLVITNLKQYTQFTVRVAALNRVGLGHFSDTKTVRTLGIQGEPDSPVLSVNEMKVESNSFFVPLKQIDDGGSPLQNFNIRYKQDKEETEWIEMRLPSDADSISLKDLSFGSGYELEVTAINANGTSLPAIFNFTIGDEPVKSRLTKGGVIGIVIFIFLVVFLVVDATCCYRNHCGLLMSIAVKVFGRKVPGLKTFEDGEGTNNGEVKLKGISTPRGSMQLAGVNKCTKGELTEVTCDKASLTKHEKVQPGRDLPVA